MLIRINILFTSFFFPAGVKVKLYVTHNQEKEIIPNVPVIIKWQVNMQLSEISAAHLTLLASTGCLASCVTLLDLVGFGFYCFGLVCVFFQMYVPATRFHISVAVCIICQRCGKYNCVKSRGGWTRPSSLACCPKMLLWKPTNSVFLPST